MYMTISRTFTAIAALSLLLCTGCTGAQQNNSRAEESSAVTTTTTAMTTVETTVETTTVPTLAAPPRLVADSISNTKMAWHFENTLPLWTFTSAAFTLEKMVDPLTPEAIPKLAMIEWHTALYEIEPESEITGVADWEIEYGALPPGDYRLTKVFYLDDHCETPLTLYVDFTIPESQ